MATAQTNLLNTMARVLLRLEANSQQQADSRAIVIMKEISYIKEFSGNRQELTQFINVVDNHMSLTPEDRRAAMWTAISQCKVIGKAKELLLTNNMSTWEEAKSILKLSFRPSIDQGEVTRRINNLRVSSVLDLINKIEYSLTDIHTIIMYENNKDYLKTMLYSLVINKIRELAAGNLAREIRDEYDLLKIKSILYSYVGFDIGNVLTNGNNTRGNHDFRPTERTYRQNNQQLRNNTNNNSRQTNQQQQSTDYNFTRTNDTERRHTYNNSGHTSQNQLNNTIQNSNQTRNNYNYNNNYSRQTRNRQNVDPMDINNIDQGSSEVVQEEIHSIEAPVFLNVASLVGKHR